MRRMLGFAVILLVTSPSASRAQMVSPPSRILPHPAAARPNLATQPSPLAPPSSFAQRSSAPSSPAPSSSAQNLPALSRENRIKVWGALFRAQVERCWRRPVSTSGKPRQAVFSLGLTRDGMVARLTPVSASAITADNNSYYASCFEAVLRCQPYRLPNADYEAWRLFEPVFNEVAR